MGHLAAAPAIRATSHLVLLIRKANQIMDSKQAEVRRSRNQKKPISRLTAIPVNVEQYTKLYLITKLP